MYPTDVAIMLSGFYSAKSFAIYFSVPQKHPAPNVATFKF